MSNIDGSCHFYRNRLSKFDDGTLTLINNCGQLYEGNDTFYKIWAQFDGNKSLAEIVSEFQNQFDSSLAEEIRSDIVEIVGDMLNLGIIDELKRPEMPILFTNSDLLSAHIAITNRCNLKCNHCYLKGQEICSITREEYRSLLDELKSIGILTIEISGGEPLLHNDFLWFLSLTKELGFYVKLFTNATLLTIENVQDIIRNVDSFRISIDGGEITHNLRRGKGAYLKTISALPLLKGSDVQISMTIDADNVSDIIHVKNIAESYDFKFELSPVVPYDSIHSTRRKMIDLMREINKTMMYIGTVGRRYAHTGINCEAAIRQLYINSKLQVFPCPLLSEDKWMIGHLRENKLTHILNSVRYFEVLNNLNILKSNCVKCNNCSFWCAAMVDQMKDKKSPFCLYKNG